MAYGRHWDAGRITDVVSLFAADGEWRSKHGTATGQTAITALLERLAAGRGTQDAPARRHFSTNVSVDVQEGIALAESDFLVVQSDQGHFAVVSMGSYRDRLVRLPDGWRFARREIVHPT